MPAWALAQDHDHVYRGRVIDVGGETLPGVHVTCKQDGRTKQAKTSDSGDYVLKADGEACATLEFEIEGFVTERILLPQGPVVDVALAIGSVGSAEGPSPMLGGLVVDASDKPAPDASVWLIKLGTGRTVGVRTDQGGRFTLPLYEFSGDYAICARGVGTKAGVACLGVNAEDSKRLKDLRLKLASLPK